ncbi:MAG: pitrilysin family protein [Pseudomonadota bacterium]
MGEPAPTPVLLANGVRTICHPARDAHSVALGLWVQAGTLDETPTEHGIAHLLEHMAFKSTTTRSTRDISIAVEAVGASLDAATSHQRTAYYVRCLPGDAEALCEILGDILLNPALIAAELETEQDVVIQEIGEAADEPDDVLFETLASLAWGDENLGSPILGTPGSVKAQTPESLRAFMARTYGGPNIVFSTAGEITPTETERLASTYFSGFADAPPGAPRAQPHWHGGARAIHRDLQQSHLATAFPGYGYCKERFVAARLFAEILGGGSASRLFQSVREDRGLAYSVYAYADVFDQTGLIGFYLGTDQDRAGEALRLAMDEVRALADNVEDDELDRAKAMARAGLLMAQENHAAKAEGAAQSLHIFGRVRPAKEILDQIMTVTPEDVAQIACMVCETNRPALCTVGPLEKGWTQAAAETLTRVAV